MQKIRRLLVVSTEDSTKLSSWSNVPYLFCRSLEEQGLCLDRLTLQENMLMRQLVLWAQKLFGVFGGGGSAWSYSRSSIYFWSAQRQINKAIKNCQAEAVLVLNFSYGPSLPSKIPLYMFCDWSYGYAIECQRGRSPDKFEERSIRRENALIDAADGVFVLFPLAAKYIQRVLPKARSYYLGNVINSVENPEELDIQQKEAGLSLLFIGKPHYLEGARQLVDAYRELKNNFPRLKLDIVGITPEFFEDLPDGVVCHGYLDKGDPEQREKYYALLRRARLFVNPNPKWASFSAALEAMYFYTPLVTSAYAEMEETFGKDISFGSYYRGHDSISLAGLLEELIMKEDFRSMALRAHAEASPFSWNAYMARVLEVIARDSMLERAA